MYKWTIGQFTIKSKGDYEPWVMEPFDEELFKKLYLVNGHNSSFVGDTPSMIDLAIGINKVFKGKDIKYEGPNIGTIKEIPENAVY